MVVIFDDDDDKDNDNDDDDDDDDESEGGLGSDNVVEQENKQPAGKAIPSAATFGLYRRAR